MRVKMLGKKYNKEQRLFGIKTLIAEMLNIIYPYNCFITITKLYLKCFYSVGK